MALLPNEKIIHQIPDKLFTKDFVIVSLGSLAAMIGHLSLMPTLPLYVKDLSGTHVDIGIIMGVFSASCVASRFLGGRAIDTWGRKRILLAGTFIYFLAMLALAFASGISGLAAVRLLQGLGFGLMTTASATLVADLAPPRRRAAAVGYYSMFAVAAMAIAPGIGLAIVGMQGLPVVGFPLLFVTGALLAALSLAISFFISDSRHSAVKKTGPTPFSARDFIIPATLPLALSMLLTSPSFGAVATFLPLYVGSEGAANLTVFFFVYALAVLLSRPITANLADRIGTRKVLIPAMALAVVSVALLASSSTMPILAIVAVSYGLGYGNIYPNLLALGVDEVPHRQRGMAMGIYLAAFDSGVALGAIGYGFIAEHTGYGTMFLTVSITTLVALSYFLLYPRFVSRGRREVRLPTAAERN